MNDIIKLDKKGLKLWAFIFILTFIAIILSGYQAKSNDSRFYSDLIRQLKDLPISDWIAPTWQNHYGRDWYRPIRDHLMGHIFTGLLVNKLGIPFKHSLQLVCLLYQFASFFIIFLMTRMYFDIKKSSIVFWALQLIPISITYGIRTNHEQALLFYILLSVYAVLRMQQSKKWIFVVWLCSIAVFLIKGIVVVMVPAALVAACVLSLNRPKDILINSILVLFSYALVFITAYGYEQIYQSVTGLSFFSEYFRVQIGERTLGTEQSSVMILEKLKNLKYYLGRSFYYTAPWSIWAIFHLVKKWKKKTLSKINPIGVSEKNPVRFYLVMIVVALVYILAFSLSNRTASRYIYHVYFFIAPVMVLFLINNSEKLQKFHEKIYQKGVFKIASLIWGILIIVQIISAQFHPPLTPYIRTPGDDHPSMYFSEEVLKTRFKYPPDPIVD